MPFARIAITLPKDILAAADRRAKALDRSRSGVIVDALRAYLATPAVVREPTQPAYGSDAYGVARLEQLERDLAKSPTERLHAAEQAAGLAKSVRRTPGSGRRHQIIGFDSYEDFYEWKRANRR
jgi:ribbon-helix-helix CopG family protein